jgi:predicted phosphoserine aminotransferase
MSHQSHVRLFIPGPVEVRPEVLAAQTQPMIGHRSPEYADLHGRLVPKLRPMFGTEGRVFIVTSSGSGLQEAAARNTVRERCLSMVNGAFGERWYKTVLSNGKEADAVQVEWGKGVRPELVDEHLRTGKYDAVTVVFNETSTGTLNPVPEIAEVVRRYPDVMLLVDAVSAAAGVEILADAWGIDVCLTSSQKAIAIPPGLALCSVSDRAMERAAAIPSRGYYFDFLSYEKSAAKNNTPSTPAISLMFALDAQMDAIAAEGWQTRFDRHKRMQKQVADWVVARGFDFFTEEPYRSPTVTTITNTHSIDVGKLNAFLRQHNMLISNGYGDLKGKTFRIAHMGDTTEEEIAHLLQTIDAYLEQK